MNLCTQSKCLLGGSVSAFVSIKDTLFVNLLCCPKEMRERLIPCRLAESTSHTFYFGLCTLLAKNRGQRLRE